MAEVRAAEDKIFPSDPSDVQSGPFEAQLTLRGITERVGLGPYLASGPRGILQVSGAPSPLLCLVPSLSLSPLPHSLLSPAPVFLSCSISLIHRRFIPRGPLPFPYLPGSWWPWPEGTELVNSSSPPTCHTPNEAPCRRALRVRAQEAWGLALPAVGPPPQAMTSSWACVPVPQCTHLQSESILPFYYPSSMLPLPPLPPHTHIPSFKFRAIGLYLFVTINSEADLV